MFGIGLPEMILILALALIVVGPEKLPDLARSLARTILDLKKTAEGLKASFREEGNPLDEIRPELEDAARSLKTNLLEQPTSAWEQDTPFPGINPSSPDAPQASQTVVDAEFTEIPGRDSIDEAQAIETQPPEPPHPTAITTTTKDMSVVQTGEDDGK
jgi:sec-independent protein translocase protein TatB